MIEALLFDVFGTVVDWRTGVAREVEAFFADSERTVDPLAFADSWRAKYQPSMEEVRTGRRGYVALDLLHRENLDATLADFGLGDAVDDGAVRVSTGHGRSCRPGRTRCPALRRYAAATSSRPVPMARLR